MLADLLRELVSLHRVLADPLRLLMNLLRELADLLRELAAPLPAAVNLLPAAAGLLGMLESLCPTVALDLPEISVRGVAGPHPSAFKFVAGSLCAGPLGTRRVSC